MGNCLRHTHCTKAHAQSPLWRILSLLCHERVLSRSKVIKGGQRRYPKGHWVGWGQVYFKSSLL